MRIQMTMTLPRVAGSVPLARRTLATALSTAGVERDCVGEVEVALSEACTNVLLHAGRGDFEVNLTIGEDQLIMHVLDTGDGFGAMPVTPQMPAPDVEVGRGLALIRELMDEATFDSASDGGGSVHLVKRLRWSERPIPRSEVWTTTERETPSAASIRGDGGAPEPRPMEVSDPAGGDADG